MIRALCKSTTTALLSRHYWLCACTLLVAGLLAGCGDPRSTGLSDLSPVWKIEIDHANGSVFAEGRVLDLYTELRLTDGDALRISWAGQLWQLYRVNAPFVYSRVFDLPNNSNRFEARFDRSEPTLASTVFDVVVPDMQSVSLVEENMTISETSTWNLSWDYGSTPVLLTRQSVQTRLLDCPTGTDISDSQEFALEPSARSVSISLQNLAQPALSASGICNYSIQLVAETFIENPETVSVKTRSRLLTSTIEFIANP